MQVWEVGGRSIISGYFGPRALEEDRLQEREKGLGRRGAMFDTKTTCGEGVGPESGKTAALKPSQAHRAAAFLSAALTIKQTPLVSRTLTFP